METKDKRILIHFGDRVYLKLYRRYLDSNLPGDCASELGCKMIPHVDYKSEGFLVPRKYAEIFRQFGTIRQLVSYASIEQCAREMANNDYSLNIETDYII